MKNKIKQLFKAGKWKKLQQLRNNNPPSSKNSSYNNFNYTNMH